ncbi:hypothetical protein J7K18_00975 [bacterium]|nr:hypothetical protein [bacterium]
MRRLVFLFLLFPVFLFAGDGTTLVVPPFEHCWGVHKGTEEKLKLLLGKDKSFNDPQGLSCVKLFAWDDTTTDEDDDELTVYGVNSGNNEIIYNNSMHSLGIWGNRYGSEVKMSSPKGIAADPEGNVYIADCGAHRVVYLVNDGKDLHFVNTIGDDILSAPFDIALDSRGFLYVTDTVKSAIFKFSPDGEFVTAIGEGVLWSPKGIDVVDMGEKWRYYNEEFIAVVDSFSMRVVRLSMDGRLEGRVSSSDYFASPVEFNYLALDYMNDIWVTDRVNHIIHKFDHHLSFLTVFGGYGTKNGQFVEPRGICIWRRYGQTFVSERIGAQYFWIGTDIKDLSVKRDGDELRISYTLTERSLVTVEILDRKGKKRLDTPINKTVLKAGRRTTVWRIPREHLGRGVILVRITAEPRYSSKGHLVSTREKKAKI